MYLHFTRIRASHLSEPRIAHHLIYFVSNRNDSVPVFLVLCECQFGLLISFSDKRNTLSQEYGYGGQIDCINKSRIQEGGSKLSSAHQPDAFDPFHHRQLPAILVLAGWKDVGSLGRAW